MFVFLRLRVVSGERGETSRPTRQGVRPRSKTPKLTPGAPSWWQRSVCYGPRSPSASTGPPPAPRGRRRASTAFAFSLETAETTSESNPREVHGGIRTEDGAFCVCVQARPKNREQKQARRSLFYLLGEQQKSTHIFQGQRTARLQEVFEEQAEEELASPASVS